MLKLSRALSFAAIALALFATQPWAVAQQTVTLKYHKSVGGCVPLAVDTAFVHLVAEVEADAPPGDYIYATSPLGSNRPSGNVDIRVNPDHTFSYVGGDSFAFGWNAAAGGGTEVITLTNPPSGIQHTEGTVNYVIASVCDGRTGGDGYDVYVPVTIGSPKPSYMKPCDLANGGDGGNCPTCNQKGMARYSAHSMMASLQIKDSPVGYAPPLGPAVNFTVSYSQRDYQEPQALTSSSLGPRWTFNWLSCVTDDPNSQLAITMVYVAGGGREVYAFDPGTQTFSTEPQSHATLVRTSSSSYERRLPDGSKQVFSQTNGATAYPRRIFLTQFIDLAGNSVSITYDTSLRIASITDAVGRSTTLYYDLLNDPCPNDQIIGRV